MPRFVTIGYGDRAGYDRTDPAIRDAAHQHDERLSLGDQPRFGDALCGRTRCRRGVATAIHSVGAVTMALSLARALGQWLHEPLYAEKPVLVLLC